jgi:hypothetical protein
MLDYAWQKLKKKSKQKNDIFTRVFNFLGGRPKLGHAFSHSCLPFPNFFGQVMHFCKSPSIVLIDTYC